MELAWACVPPATIQEYVVSIGRSWRYLEEACVTISGYQWRCGPYSEAPKGQD
jgi:hypothetical protein